MKYIDEIRKRSCIVCGGQAEPHHLQAIGMGRNRKGEKIEDYSAVPLCRTHHIEMHTGGLKNFEEKYKVNLWREAHRLLVKIVLMGFICLLMCSYEGRLSFGAI